MVKLYPICDQLWPTFLFNFEAEPSPSKMLIFVGDDGDYQSFLLCDVDEYIRGGCWFCKWFSVLLALCWKYFGFLISTFGVMNLLQSQGRFLMNSTHDFKNKAGILYHIGSIFHGDFNSEVILLLDKVHFTQRYHIWLHKTCFYRVNKVL